MNNTTKAHLALLGANLFYGAGFSVSKTLMPTMIQPQGFILIRLGATGLLFWLSYFLGKDYRTKIDMQDWPRLITCAVFGVAVNQLLFFMGLNLTSPIHASLLMLSTPLLVTILAAIYLKEKLAYWNIAGLIIAVAGAIFLIISRSTDHLASNALLGDVYIFFNACAYAVYLVMVKPLMKKYRPIIIIRWLFLIGFVIVMPFGFQQFMAIQWQQFTSQNWQALAFVILGITFFTFLWNIYALRVLKASVAGSYIYLQPIFAAIIATIFMKEILTWQKIIAACLIFTGVLLATKVFKQNTEKQSL
jgi:drug/metabolite transporter (DMT)-like permease